MRVRRIRPILLSAPYAADEELVWVGGRIESWDAALVEVTTDEGVTGLGEVAQGIMAAAAVPGVVDALRPYLLGQHLVPLEVGDRLRSQTAFWARGGVAAGVIGAVETAMLDAAAKTVGLPLHLLLGGPAHERIELYASGGLGETFDEIAAWASDQAAAGFGTVKFRAMRDPWTTMELIDALVPQLAPGVRFVIDAVQACAARPWSADEAIPVGRLAADLGARWFEEPCHAEDLDGYARVRRAVEAPVSGIESASSVGEFERLIAAGCIDVAQPDAGMVGGPMSVRRIAELADAGGLDCVPHVWGSAVTLMANLHTAFATPTMPLFELCTLPNPLRDELLVAPLEIRDGHVLPPTEPGIGVRLPEGIEERHPFGARNGHHIT